MGHKVVALLSGGKDSCFAIHQCLEYNHDVIALANLHPEQKDELDSFMFQTVGWNVVSAYADCLDLPLYRTVLEGTSVHKSLSYEPTEDDEVENLFLLLKRVKEAHPDLTAVTSGAILSNYQRNRVENVCERLGLVSLSYLWMKEQHELFEKMCSCPINAILIKVASMGLKVNYLGRTIQDLKPLLTSLHYKFGFHVCGEGGEYESLTLDSPLFVKKIVLDKVQTIVDCDDDFSPVAYLHIEKFHIEDKITKSEERKKMELLQRQKICTSPSICHVPFVPPSLDKEYETDFSYHKTGAFLCARGAIPSGDLCAADQTYLLLSLLSREIENKFGLPLRTNVLFVHFYLSNMDQFQCVNRVYVDFFDPTQPPSRECVHFALPKNCHVAMELVCIENKDLKSILHVQSISEWAPACIGPYSQACSIQGVISLAGMIGLDPPTMQLVKQEEELHRCLSSLNAVYDAMGTDAQRVVSCTLYFTPEFRNETYQEKIEELQEWLAFHSVLCRFVGVVSLPRASSVEIQTIAFSKEYDYITKKNEYEKEEESKVEEISISKDFFSINGFSCSMDFLIAPHTLTKAIQIHISEPKNEEEFELLVSSFFIQKLEIWMKAHQSSWCAISRARLFYRSCFPYVNTMIVREMKARGATIPLTSIGVSDLFHIQCTDPCLSLELYFYE